MALEYRKHVVNEKGISLHDHNNFCNTLTFVVYTRLGGWTIFIASTTKRTRRSDTRLIGLAL